MIAHETTPKFAVNTDPRKRSWQLERLTATAAGGNKIAPAAEPAITVGKRVLVQLREVG
jgi:hypothetical protein